MKFIFDFDDVLFNNTVEFKKHMYAVLEDAGISKESAEVVYLKERHHFSLLPFLRSLLTSAGKESRLMEVYEKIMGEAPNFVNTKLVKLIKKNLKKEDIYIVTHGVDEYQREKIMMCGLGEFFLQSHIETVTGSKKEKIEKICRENKDYTVVFVDDKDHHLQGLDHIPNLKTILFDENGLEKLKTISNTSQ